MDSWNCSLEWARGHAQLGTSSMLIDKEASMSWKELLAKHETVVPFGAYGPFHHQINKGGLEEIITGGKLRASEAAQWR